MLNRLLCRLRGPPGYGVALLILLAYINIGLWPFRWALPARIRNGAVLTPDGVLRFASPGIARSDVAPDWIREAMEQHAIRIQLRFRSSASDQKGPARLFTISPDPYERNLTIGQEASDLIVRLRTWESASDQKPNYRQYALPRVFVHSQWQDLDLRVSPDKLEVSIDEQVLLTEDLPSRPLETWSAAFNVAFGNELTGDRSWLGEISTPVIRVKGKRIDCFRPGTMVMPKFYWEGPVKDFELNLWGSPADVVMNVVCFVPLGFVLATAWWNRGALFFAVTLCALVSLAVESAQIAFDDRIPSLLDWLANSGGAAIGALCAGVITNGRKQ